MSRQKKKQSTKTRRKHPPEFKSEALALADRVGVSEAARQLKLQSSQLYSWRTQVQSEKQKDVASQALATENARLKRQLAEKKQELEIIKKAAATNSNHNLPIAPNLLNQDFSATAPNQKWVGDITYLWTDEGWLYLAVVIDLYSRSVVGWAMDRRMKSELVCQALTMALERRGSPSGVIVHTDRGSQYCSKTYQKIISTYSLKCSMSKKGDCYDNACAESFFHSLKVELTHGSYYESRSQLRREIFEYIEAYYNVVRLHSSNDYNSPSDFEMLKVA